MAGIIGGLGSWIIKQTSNLITNAKAGKAALAAGFVQPTLQQTAQQQQQLTGQQPAPGQPVLQWYMQPVVWVVGAVLFLIVLFGMILPKRKR